MIRPEQLPDWMTSDLVLDSQKLGWNEIAFRQYHAPPQELVAPAVRDYALVTYLNRARIERRCEGASAWQSEAVGPGAVSIQTRTQSSEWRWSEAVDALHVYLPYRGLAKIAEEVTGREVRGIDLVNTLDRSDPVIAHAASLLAAEARSEALGGQLYVDAIRCQLSIHLLREYATIEMPDTRSQEGLSPEEKRRILGYIDANLSDHIALADLAGVLRLSIFSFSRRFQHEFGCPPYAYVIKARLEQACRQLRFRDIPLKVVAANCGFADQSHMTRLFRRSMKLTPAQYRREVISAH